MTKNICEGDVVRYKPEQLHCREGLAIAKKRFNGELYLLDTFWGTSGSDRALVRSDWQFLFNVNDYDEVTKEKWRRHHPDDRQVITSQHGLQNIYLIRKGATEDLATQVENAREAYHEAEAVVRSANRQLERKRQELETAEQRLRDAQTEES